MPMLSVMPSVTPVCFASMYTGVMPDVHGIKFYTKPVLKIETFFDVLIKADVVDVAVVVTRYFGGILLGGGGLVRAYSHATTLAIDSAKVITMAPCEEFLIKCDYNFYGKLSYALPSLKAKTLSSDFGEEITLEVRLLQEDTDAFVKGIIELSNGTVTPEKTRELFCEI